MANTVSLDVARGLKECECGCGTVFEATDSKGRYRRYTPGHNSKAEHPMRGKKAKNNKGGVITRQGYKLIYVKMDERRYHTCKKDGFAFEHRYVMETHLGRKLERYEAVHHINGDKLDNQIENLKLMTDKAHAKYESKRRPTNWKAIEAMRQVNIKTEKATCEVKGCNKEMLARGLCNAHYHYFRRGLVHYIDGKPAVIKLKRQQKPQIKNCAVCGDVFMARSNRAKNCEVCRQPHLETRRYRERRKNDANSLK